jgi:hypothetical protein
VQVIAVFQMEEGERISRRKEGDGDSGSVKSYGCGSFLVLASNFSVLSQIVRTVLLVKPQT